MKKSRKRRPKSWSAPGNPRGNRSGCKIPVSDDGISAAGSLARREASLWPAGSRHLFEPLARFKSWARNTRFLRLIEREIPKLVA